MLVASLSKDCLLDNLSFVALSVLYKLRVYKSEPHTVRLILINYPTLLKSLV